MKKFLLIALLLWAVPAFADVAENGTGTAVASGTGTSADLGTFTVDAGSNLCLVAVIFLDNTSGGAFVLNWDSAGTPQAMTQATLTFNVTSSVRGAIFYLANPTTGNKNLNATWPTSRNWTLMAAAFSGASAACINAANTVNTNNVGPSASPTVTVSSTTTGATFGVVAISGGATISSTDSGTEVGRTGAYAASYFIPSGTSNAHNWTASGSQTYAVAGIHIPAYSAATSSMTMMGVGR